MPSHEPSPACTKPELACLARSTSCTRPIVVYPASALATGEFLLWINVWRHQSAASTRGLYRRQSRRHHVPQRSHRITPKLSFYLHQSRTMSIISGAFRGNISSTDASSSTNATSPPLSRNFKESPTRTYVSTIPTCISSPVDARKCTFARSAKSPVMSTQLRLPPRKNHIAHTQIAYLVIGMKTTSNHVARSLQTKEDARQTNYKTQPRGPHQKHRQRHRTLESLLCSQGSLVTLQYHHAFYTNEF